MKPPSPAPGYIQHYLITCEIARSCGYALAIHGSMARDLDVVAVPWTDEAVSAEDLAAKVAEQFAWVITGDDGEKRLVVGPTKMPHGRLAWSIPLMGHSSIDLSVMPRREPPPHDGEGV